MRKNLKNMTIPCLCRVRPRLCSPPSIFSRGSREFFCSGEARPAKAAQVGGTIDIRLGKGLETRPINKYSPGSSSPQAFPDKMAGTTFAQERAENNVSVDCGKGNTFHKVHGFVGCFISHSDDFQDAHY